MSACETECCTSSDPATLRTDGLRVGQLAHAVGVKADTIRFDEKAGLLAPPPRTNGDHRRYEATAVDRLQFIQGAQRLCLRLREIKASCRFVTPAPAPVPRHRSCCANT